MRRVYVNSRLSKRQTVGETPFNPANITNILAWYDPESLSLSHNDPVQSWPSTLSTEVTLTQTTANKQPAFRTNALNGHPTLLFDGTNDSLISPNLNMTSGNVIFVIRFLTALADRRVWSGQNEGEYVNGSLMMNNSSQFSVVGGNGGKATTIWTNPAINTWYVIITEHTANSVACYVNGVKKNQVTEVTRYAVMGLCERLAGYGLNANAEVAMFGLVKGTPLVPEERSQVEAWLMNRFNIS